MTTENTKVRTDEKGRIRQVDHSLQPQPASGKSTAGKPEAIAARYIRKALEVENVNTAFPTDDNLEKSKSDPSTGSELWVEDLKRMRDVGVIEFGQYYNGVRVWNSGVTVMCKARTGEVVEASNGYNYDLPKLRFSRKNLDSHTAGLNEGRLESILELKRNRRRMNALKKSIRERELPIDLDLLDAQPEFVITRRGQVIYRYDPKKRKHAMARDDNPDRDLVQRALNLSLPPVSDKVKPGAYRAATEVLFTSHVAGMQMNWHAVIDYLTDSLLYITALYENVDATGYVYDHDPVTATGDTSILPSSSTAVLNGPRNPRSLASVGPPDLNGVYVEVQDLLPVPSAPPTSPAGKFDYDADTDDFSAVNAYHHSDGVFRMVEEMGFDMNVYFDGTQFPVPVDHRGSSGCVNAAAWGNPNNDGLGSFTYGLVEAGQPVGIATDVRVVLHEFGHAILWDNVHSPNFGFAHSCGDSLAAVLCDPRSKAPDRFLTFPWVAAIPRRHDRDIAGGWAWRGNMDDGGYQSEQILSTSHFRAYRSLGGDHLDVCEREWASRYLTFLMIHAVGTLTPATNPGAPEAWSDRLQLCDRVTEVFEGHPGAAVHKVIRWAFEQQGAYPAAGASRPVTTIGEPPRYDIYINDGREGEYEFTLDWCHTQDVWNRNCPDGYPAHQAPIPGIENHAYVIVRNRGTEYVKKGTVRAFHKRDDACCDCCDDCAELNWPEDFLPMITEQLAFGAVAPGDYAIVGPFTWKPKHGDCILMVADIPGDPSNISLIMKGQTLLTKRLVPFDNNIALRCICKQCNPDYSRLVFEKPCPKRREDYWKDER